MIRMSEQILRVGNYILLEKLAAGGMAEVYLAKMASSDKLVALKKILPVHAETPEYLNLFKEEVKVSLNLQHGNIVGFIDFIHENDQMYLVMEFINGFNLLRLMADLRFKKTKFNLPQCLFIVSEVASGLDYAHRSVDAITTKKLNIIHRDINPHNIMVAFDGNIKIIDFGIAKADSRSDITKVGTIKGKFSYMSPEQASAQPLDCRADIYALGVVFWELLTGRRLHDGKNDLETLTKIKNSPVPPPREFDPRIPSELERIVMKALEKDLNKRYQKISDFKFELDQYLQTNFPEFRPADFAAYVGGMYAELIKSRVEKLLYFSKVKFQTNTILAGLPESRRDRRKSTSSGTEIKVELPEGFESKNPPNHDENINFEHLSKENPFVSEVKVQTKQKAAQFFSNKQLDEENTKIDKEKKFDVDSFFDVSFFTNFKHLAIMALIGYAGFSFYKQNFATSVAFNYPLYADQVQTTPAVQPEAPAHAQDLSRAPAKTNDFSQDIYRKLKESNNLAYSNISIENSPTADTKIFIDGKLLYQRAPIQKFPVYANQLTTITAYNKKLNLYDEKKVTIPPGDTMDVKLIMRHYSK